MQLKKEKAFSLKFKGDMPLVKHFHIFDELMIELLAAGGGISEMAETADLLLTLPSSYDGIAAIQTIIIWGNKTNTHKRTGRLNIT